MAHARLFKEKSSEPSFIPVKSSPEIDTLEIAYHGLISRFDIIIQEFVDMQEMANDTFRLLDEEDVPGAKNDAKQKEKSAEITATSIQKLQTQLNQFMGEIKKYNTDYLDNDDNTSILIEKIKSAFAEKNMPEFQSKCTELKSQLSNLTDKKKLFLKSKIKAIPKDSKSENTSPSCVVS